MKNLKNLKCEHTVKRKSIPMEDADYSFCPVCIQEAIDADDMHPLFYGESPQEIEDRKKFLKLLIDFTSPNTDETLELLKKGDSSAYARIGALARKMDEANLNFTKEINFAEKEKLVSEKLIEVNEIINLIVTETEKYKPNDEDSFDELESASDLATYAKISLTTYKFMYEVGKEMEKMGKNYIKQYNDLKRILRNN